MRQSSLAAHHIMVVAQDDSRQRSTLEAHCSTVMARQDSRLAAKRQWGAAPFLWAQRLRKLMQPSLMQVSQPTQILPQDTR